MTEEYLISEIDQLKLENAELKLALGIASAFPVKVSMQCRKMIDSKLSSLEFLSVLCDSANRAISESSCDQLVGIKADGIIEAANYLCVSGSSVKTVRYDAYIEYAENLRKESK